MTPFNVQDEIFILFFAAHDADGQPLAYQKAVAYTPGVFGRIDIYPAGKVLAVEEALKLGRFVGVGGE